MGSSLSLKGVRDGKQTPDSALRSISGYYDHALITTTELDEDIDLESAIGVTGARVSAIIPTADGNILLKSYNNGSNGYVTYPATSGQEIGQLPDIQYVKKTGSIATFIVKYQVVNQ